MKKTLLGKAASLVTAAAMSASLLSVVPTVSAESSAGAVVEAGSADFYIRGDALTDNTLNNMDALEIQKHLAQLITLDDDAMIAGDANADGTLNLADAVSIMQWIVTIDRTMYAGDYTKWDGSAYPVHYPSDGTLNNAVTETTNDGFSGNSYVNFSNETGSSATMKVTTEMAGNYKLHIRYANGTDANRQMYISANGSSQGVLADFNSTGGWTEWSEAIYIIYLNEGDNEITFTSATADGGPNIDNFSICRTCMLADELADIPQDLIQPSTNPDVTTTTTVPEEQTTTTTTTTTAPPEQITADRYYAIEADYYDGWEENTNAGFAGEGYFNYDNDTGSYVEWTVEVPADGNYKVDFRFANGTDTNRITRITVNGSKSECYYMDFNGTGAWTTWATNSVVLELKAGTNTIKAYATTDNGGPNMDYIEISSTDDAAAAMVKPTDGKQVEALNRGVSAAYTGSGVLVSWRILATDDPNTTFDLWKNGQEKLGTFTLSDASNYLDTAGTATDWYTIDTFVNGEMTEFAQASINLTNKNSGQSGAYFDIPLTAPAGVTTPDGVTCTYSANDASVGDVDGDGEYEIILKWDPSNSQDNSKDGYTGNVYLDCYKLNGTRLWRIDLGKNIRAGAHYTQFMVYDYDSDGKAELVCKTADGTVDGQGNVIGDASADYRSTAGRILTGPEYLTLFDGETGKALDTINYNPGRGDVSAWGDSYGNRVDRFTAATAYLDGKTPSVIMNRGYYTRMTACAYDIVDDKFVQRWFFDTGNSESAAGYHDGNHNCMPADVDLDGKDELVMGSAVIDDDGTLLYTSGLNHGDAMHVGDFVPENEGIEIFMCHEGAGYGISLRDGETGELILREEASGDTGRCIAGNLIASNPGAEFVGSHNSVIYNAAHEQVALWSDITKWGQNSVVYWSDTLERAVLDRTMVDQHGKGRIFTGDGVTYNNASKSNACITCDLFGDWREELVFASSDATYLRVFGTTYSTEYAIYTLMHNPQYRAQVAGQNVGYNQPPHTDYYIGSEVGEVPEAPEVHTAG